MTKKDAVEAARKRLVRCGVNEVCTDLLSHYQDNLVDNDYTNCVDSLVTDSLYWSGKILPVTGIPKKMKKLTLYTK